VSPVHSAIRSTARRAVALPLPPGVYREPAPAAPALAPVGILTGEGVVTMSVKRMARALFGVPGAPAAAVAGRGGVEGGFDPAPLPAWEAAAVAREGAMAAAIILAGERPLPGTGAR
jgi:hypothetical protein